MESEYFHELLDYLKAVARRLPCEEQAELSEAIVVLSKIRAGRRRANLLAETDIDASNDRSSEADSLS
jgi:hypothetical protein